MQHDGGTMNVKVTQNMKQSMRPLGRKVRGGLATPKEEAAFDRIDRALNYITDRHQRGNPAPRGWWDLPIAERCWNADARDLGA